MTGTDQENQTLSRMLDHDRRIVILLESEDVTNVTRLDILLENVEKRLRLFDAILVGRGGIKLRSVLGSWE